MGDDKTTTYDDWNHFLGSSILLFRGGDYYYYNIGAWNRTTMFQAKRLGTQGREGFYNRHHIVLHQGSKRGQQKGYKAVIIFIITINCLFHQSSPSSLNHHLLAQSNLLLLHAHVLTGPPYNPSWQLAKQILNWCHVLTFIFFLFPCCLWEFLLKVWWIEEELKGKVVVSSMVKCSPASLKISVSLWECQCGFLSAMGLFFTVHGSRKGA